MTRFRLLYVDWRGYVVAFFALVWVANQYMSIYNRLRLDIKHEQVEIKADEKKVDNRKAACVAAMGSNRQRRRHLVMPAGGNDDFDDGSRVRIRQS